MGQDWRNGRARRITSAMERLDRCKHARCKIQRDLALPQAPGVGDCVGNLFRSVGDPWGFLLFRLTKAGAPPVHVPVLLYVPSIRRSIFTSPFPGSRHSETVESTAVFLGRIQHSMLSISPNVDLASVSQSIGTGDMEQCNPFLPLEISRVLKTSLPPTDIHVVIHGLLITYHFGRWITKAHSLCHTWRWV